MLLETTQLTTESNLAYLIKNYVSYNQWANNTIVEWLKKKPAELMDQEVPSSFPTLKLTLIHIIQTQRYWFSVVQKDSDFVNEPVNGSADDIFEALLTQSAEMLGYIDTMNEEMIQEENLVTNPWFECNFPNFEYILHLVNHTTYHRGQLVTIGRNLGLTDAPMTDYNFYNVRVK